jgi:hypothetical protein
VADNPRLRGKADRSRINLSEPHEVRYWSEALGISEECLRDTVGQLGNRVKDVREAIEHLKVARAAGRRPSRRATPTRR